MRPLLSKTVEQRDRYMERTESPEPGRIADVTGIGMEDQVTNILGFKPRAPLECQAPEWVIRLDSDEPLSEDEEQALRDWLACNPMHREEFTRLSEFWREADVLATLAVPLRSRRGAGSWRVFGFVSAVVVSAAVIMVLGWRYLSKP
jgi:Domain of unknown function (DUF4880)